MNRRLASWILIAVLGAADAVVALWLHEAWNDRTVHEASIRSPEAGTRHTVAAPLRDTPPVRSQP